MSALAAMADSLVGRDAELRALDAVLGRALGGQAQVVALSGPAGVGKSRLAQKCLSAAHGRGFLSLVGVSGALQQDLSYAPLVEALRPLVREGSALMEGLLDLGRLFGDLSLPPGPALGDPGLERTRLFESVCRLLQRASQRQPLAMLLDDAHWADRGSLAMLHYLVRGLVDRPLLVVLTYREDEATPDLRELLAGLRRGGSLTELELAGLSDQAVGLLARNLLAGEAPPELLDVLAARCGGVPLFVGALVGSFLESGALRRFDGRWALAARAPDALPAAVTALLRSQVERLPAEAREVLDLLAVCGAQLDHALLQRLMPGERLPRGIADLRAVGYLVEEIVDGRIRYRAAHPLLCEVAYELLPVVVRRRRHAELVRALEECAPGQHGLLAHHVRLAGEEVDSGHALDVLVEAADQALARKAGDEALADVRAALDLAEACQRPDCRPGLLDRLAEAHELAGNRDEAVSAWCAAAAERAGGARAERLTRAAVLELEAGRGDECRVYLNKAGAELVDIEPGPAHLSLAIRRLQLAARSGTSEEISSGIALVRRLGDLADPPGSRRARAAELFGRCYLALDSGRYGEGRACVPELLDLAAEVGDAFAGHVLRPAVFLELGWGDIPAARSVARESAELSRRTGVPSLEARSWVGLGIVAFFSGEWDETLRQCREVLDLAERIGMPRGIGVSLAMRGLVLLRRGRVDEALACAVRAREALSRRDRQLDRGRRFPIERAVLGVIEAVEASVALARGDAARAAAMAAASESRYSWHGLPLVILAEAQAAAGDPEAACATADLLSAIGPGAPYPGALGAWIRGRLTGDASQLRRAADDLAALGFVYEAAVAQLDLAELGASEPPALEECLRVLERLGAQPQLDRARRVLRRLGRRVPVAARQRRRGGLSPREEQVARLVAAGLSNPEIARRLYLSPRTVTTHLQNMYSRLELRSRTALTRYVLEELPPEMPPQDSPPGPPNT